MSSDDAREELVSLVLSSQLGPECGAVGALLVRQAEGLTLKEMEARLAVFVSVRGALLTLRWHKCLVVVVATPVKYRLATFNVLERLRYPRMLRAVESVLGSAAERPLRRLLFEGPLSREALGEAAVPLVQNGYIKLCGGGDDFDFDFDFRQEQQVAQPDEGRGKRRREQLIDDDEDEPRSVELPSDFSSRTARFSQRPHDDKSVWRADLVGLRFLLLRESCESLIQRKLNPAMRHVVSAMFASGSWRYGDQVGGSHRDTGVDASRLLALLPPGTLQSSGQLEQYLGALRRDSGQFVDPQRNVFDARFAIEHARTEILHATLLERYGREAARLHALLRQHKPTAAQVGLDQAELAERGLMPPRDARAHLYKLFKDGTVQLVQLASAPHDQLWAVDLKLNYRKCLNDAYAAIANLLRRRHFEQLSAMHHLEQQQHHHQDHQDHGDGGDHHPGGPRGSSSDNNHRGATTALSGVGGGGTSSAATTPQDRIDQAILDLDRFAQIFDEPRLVPETTTRKAAAP